jgi:hypothetical protein
MRTRYVVLLAITVLTLAALACGGSGSRANAPDVGDDIGACVVCQDFVKDQLVAPATAKFPICSHWEIDQKYGTTDTWTATAYVDAENRMGAMLRMEFTCEVRYKGDDNWGLLDLKTDQR